jgi:O-antigen/teichoic acid export membrane protein
MTETATEGSAQLTSGRLLARNVVWNLLGTVAPLLVAVPAVPRLIRAMGTDRFGVLTLAWVVIGYFGLFDFGFGRALTKLVAEKLGTGESEDIPGLFWTSLALMLVSGCVGGGVIAALSPWMVHSILRIPAAIQDETLRAFYLLAASLPVVIASAALRGFLEAHQRFGMSNAVRIPLGVFTFAGPFVVLPLSVSLVPMVGALAVVRLASCLVLFGLCIKVEPDLMAAMHVQWGLAKSLFRFGGWMTVSNVVSPLMVSVDRFLIGAVASISAVAYYATPWEAVTKLLLVPGAIVGVLFPAFSTGFVQDRAKTWLLFLRAVKYTALALLPFLLIAVVFAREGLTLWLGADFARHSAVVLQWLAVGVFFNGIAYVPYALTQGAGRPDLTGKLHLMELPAYTAVLWLLVRARGIDGAAMAWTARVVVDAVVLLWFAYRVLRTERENVERLSVLRGVAAGDS